MMNYKANTHHWRKGDIVIHDADAKHPKMLMIVIGYTRDGLCKTQYVDKRRRRKIFKNEIADLHDPDQFGIHPIWGDYAQHHLERICDEWDRVHIWNFHFANRLPVQVLTTSDDGGFIGTVKNKAYIGKDGGGRVYIYPGGGWDLKFTEVISTQAET